MSVLGNEKSLEYVEEYAIGINNAKFLISPVFWFSISKFDLRSKMGLVGHSTFLCQNIGFHFFVLRETQSILLASKRMEEIFLSPLLP